MVKSTMLMRRNGGFSPSARVVDSHHYIAITMGNGALHLSESIELLKAIDPASASGPEGLNANCALVIEKGIGHHWAGVRHLIQVAVTYLGLTR